MNVLVDCPQSSAGEWRFRLFDVDVRVKLWFWLGVVLLCGAQNTAAVLIWVAVCFASILIHEFAHVADFRLSGEKADIVLYGWGGLTIPYHHPRGTAQQFVTALAGPAAGFCVAALAAAAAVLSGATIRAGWHVFFPVLAAVPPNLPSRLQPTSLPYVLLNDLLWVNLYWGLVNLLPVFPLDGAHAARAVLEQHDPYNGRRKALMLSAAVAALMAAFGAVERNLYMLLIFLVLAVSSAAALEGERPRSPRVNQRWRG